MSTLWPPKPPALQRLFYDDIGHGLAIDLNLAASNYVAPDQDSPFLEPAFCEDFLREQHTLHGVDYTYGGYLEDRSDVWYGSYLRGDRAVHLGVDVNVFGGRIKCPLAFTVVDVFNDTDQRGGWGGRVTIDVGTGYVVFAHLCPTHWPLGKRHPAGSIVGAIAPAHMNGGWFRHLHLQGLKSLDQLKGLDGYGPASESNELDYPDPLKILGLYDYL